MNTYMVCVTLSWLHLSQIAFFSEAFSLSRTNHVSVKYPSIALSKRCNSAISSKGFEDEDDDSIGSKKSESVIKTVTADDMVKKVRSVSKAPIESEPTNTDYPINAPSPILLASSMVLAIASTGSIFELSGGHPVLGFIPTVIVALVGVPACFFLFYASIKKGIAETEEDDKAFQRKNGRF